MNYPLIRTENGWTYDPTCGCSDCLQYRSNLPPPQFVYQCEQVMINPNEPQSIQPAQPVVDHNRLELVSHMNSAQHLLHQRTNPNNRNCPTQHFQVPHAHQITYYPVQNQTTHPVQNQTHLVLPPSPIIVPHAHQITYYPVQNQTTHPVQNQTHPVSPPSPIINISNNLERQQSFVFEDSNITSQVSNQSSQVPAQVLRKSSAFNLLIKPINVSSEYKKFKNKIVNEICGYNIPFLEDAFKIYDARFEKKSDKFDTRSFDRLQNYVNDQISKKVKDADLNKKLTAEIPTEFKNFKQLVCLRLGKNYENFKNQIALMLNSPYFSQTLKEYYGIDIDKLSTLSFNQIRSIILLTKVGTFN
ncbi:34565_t:CDS:2 [Gigaspora margarita]|uniref:34565_t:CDS:1 n=1 Tax=Gigaspora margarita TaxID=4874 RepID=A0ABN7W5R1_GIGMA|nr:34565_t:CDS:2 [Gigaspora margarita]